MAERAAKESEMMRKGLGLGEGEWSGGKDMFETTENGL